MKIVADINIPFVKECFCSIAEMQVMPGREIASGVLKDADALLVRSITRVDEQLLAGSNVKFVGTATIGFEHIDRSYLEENGIGFSSAPGSNANSVAEYVIAALFELGLKYNFELAGKSIGIIGVGNVGSRVAEKCLAIRMKPVLNDPPLKRETCDEKYRPIEELSECDIITIHTPLTHEGLDKTYHLANEEFFKSLKRNVIFINTSRGCVVDTVALKQIIKKGKIKAIVLDVWENEPDIDNELLQMVDIGTPHIAGYSYDGKVAGMIMIYKALCEHFGISPDNDVDDFLPEAKLPEIDLITKSLSQEQVIRKAVNEVYNIKADEEHLRKTAGLSAGERSMVFDKLRKEYPVRREFHNTKINLDTPCSHILQKLSGIGFKVS